MVLLGNDINFKLVRDNIVNDSLSNIILLHGVYGTGKTEFAKIIARMLLCENFDGHKLCGTCEGCRSAQFTENEFNPRAALFNMAKVDTEKAKELVDASTKVYSSKTRAFIYDEYQAVNKKDQEIWLADADKLDNTYLILTSTKTSQIDKGILSRSLKLKMNPLSDKDAFQILEDSHFKLSDNIKSLMVKTYQGIPRDLIIMAEALTNGTSLTEEEKIEILLAYKSAPISELFELLGDIPEYFRKIREMDAKYVEEEWRRSLDDFLFTNLSLGEQGFQHPFLNYTDLLYMVSHPAKVTVKSILSMMVTKKNPSTKPERAKRKTSEPLPDSKKKETQDW